MYMYLGKNLDAFHMYHFAMPIVNIKNTERLSGQPKCVMNDHKLTIYYIKQNLRGKKISYIHVCSLYSEMQVF